MLRPQLREERAHVLVIGVANEGAEQVALGQVLEARRICRRVLFHGCLPVQHRKQQQRPPERMKGSTSVAPQCWHTACLTPCIEWTILAEVFGAAWMSVSCLGKPPVAAGRLFCACDITPPSDLAARRRAWKGRLGCGHQATQQAQPRLNLR